MSLRRYLPIKEAPLLGLGFLLFALFIGYYILKVTDKKQQNTLITKEPAIINPIAIIPVNLDLSVVKASLAQNVELPVKVASNNVSNKESTVIFDSPEKPTCCPTKIRTNAKPMVKGETPDIYNKEKELSPNIETTSTIPKKVFSTLRSKTAMLPDSIESIPDFASIRDVKLKKRKFFAWLLEFVELENNRINALRDNILSFQKQGKNKENFLPSDIIWLKSLARDYGLSPKRHPYEPEFFTALLRSVDILPPSLVLAQGANESGWGGSRFARQGNNLFGQWCYNKGCGIVPLRREKNLTHEVARYHSVRDSVRAFFLNINTHPAYAPLRKLREQLRNEQKPLTGMKLGDMLIPYSQRGKAYVDSIKALIKSNKLSQYDLL
ncbi:MAG: glucosaminidase domain-containing protein [Magnetococcales bacterium]|nr:glucosaminidase domain-containing protein [Magnetococcales bacterium]